MKFREHTGTVAIVVAVLAFVLAAGGTAVAVASKVSISDPVTASRVARVDATGRLSVGGATSTFNSAGWLFGYQDAAKTVVSSPTNATLAISRVHVSNPKANASATEQQLSLNKYPVATDGACDTTTGATLIARYNVAPGHDVSDSLPAPVIVKPTGGKYCLAFSTTYLGSGSATPAYYLAYDVSGYVVSGTYTGVGVDTPAGKQPSSARIPR